MLRSNRGCERERVVKYPLAHARSHGKANTPIVGAPVMQRRFISAGEIRPVRIFVEFHGRTRILKSTWPPPPCERWPEHLAFPAQPSLTPYAVLHVLILIPSRESVKPRK